MEFKPLQIKPKNTDEASTPRPLSHEEEKGFVPKPLTIRRKEKEEVNIENTRTNFKPLHVKEQESTPSPGQPVSFKPLRVKQQPDIPKIDNAITTRINQDTITVQPRNNVLAEAEQKERKLDTLVNRAKEIDTTFTNTDKLRARLHLLQSTEQSEWINWGAKEITSITNAIEEYAKIANAIRQMNTTKLTDECREVSSRNPSILDRMNHRDLPAYYRVKLEGVRREIQQILKIIQDIRTQVVPNVEKIRVNVLALEVIGEQATDSLQKTIAQNRLRTLVGAQQNGIMIAQTLENTETTIITSIGNIDQLLTNVIPQWAIACSHL